jgi:lysophospholipase L1-like esterase
MLSFAKRLGPVAACLWVGAGCLADSTSTTSHNDSSQATGGNVGSMGTGGSEGTAGDGTTAGPMGVGGSVSLGSEGTSGTGGNQVGSGGSAVASPDGGAADGTGSSTGGVSPGKVVAGVRWVGRVDASNAASPKFDWGGVGFVAQVSGTAVAVKLNNEDAYLFQPVVDGKPGDRVKAPRGMGTVPVATGMAPGTHTVELYRETEGSYGVSTFLGLTGATLMTPPTYSGRLIETIGDSISNGYGELGNETHPNSCAGTTNQCGFSFDTQTNYQSYTAIAARALGADWSIVAMSGWGLCRDLGGGRTSILPSVWTEAYYTSSVTVSWDFSVQANAVIINLGTNDVGTGDPGAAFQTALSNFVDAIWAKYPKAWIFPVTGSMLAGTAHESIKKYMQAVVAAKGGDASRIAYLDLGTQDGCGKGTGCDWHPNLAEHQRMASLLAPFIKQKLGW